MAVPAALLAILGTWLEHRVNPPTCYGIGWGCTLDAGGAGFFVGFFWLYACGCVALALGITELFWHKVVVLRSLVGGASVIVASVTLLLICGIVVTTALE
ncbi:MAG: hypothetical protein M3N53_09050 [Actinomycetota bacterium]|nr:hypothetical protein [Actinomycetota bacterium]